MADARRFRPDLVRLEDRRVPAVLLQLDGFGNLTGIIGTISAGNDLYLTWTSIDTVRVSEDVADTGNLGTYNAPGDLSITLGNTNDLDPQVIVDFTDGINPAGAMSGNFNVRLGNALFGYGVFFFEGAGLSIAGNLNVTSGSGADTVAIGQDPTGALAGDVDVGGSVNVNLGANADSFSIDDGSDVAGNVSANNVQSLQLNTFGGAALLIEGNLIANAGRESGVVVNDYDVGLDVTIGRNVIVTTGQAFIDNVIIEGTVLGSVIANQGNGANQVTLDSTSIVHGSLTVIGGNQGDNVTLVQGGTLLGNVTINLRNGANDFAWNDGYTVLGRAATYFGGSGVDTLDLQGQGVGIRLLASLGSGTDSVTYGANLSIAAARIDFGYGADVFANNLLAIAFPNSFRNL